MGLLAAVMLIVLIAIDIAALAALLGDGWTLTVLTVSWTRREHRHIPNDCSRRVGRRALPRHPARDIDVLLPHRWTPLT